MKYRILKRDWPSGKIPMIVVMVFELFGTIGCLVLFALAQPDLYRTLFWQIGYDNGWNSNPLMVLYAYANHDPLPTVPFVWSKTLTSFNVAISVLSLFTLLTRLIMFIMKVLFPVISLSCSFVLAILYAVSIYGQAGPDHADPTQQSNVAWYIRMNCNPAIPYGAVGDCEMAKGTFGVTVFMLFLYLCTLGLAGWGMWPNKRYDEKNEDNDSDSPPSPVNDKDLEMQPISPRIGPLSPRVPYTPRTQAFHALDRKLPLRTTYQ